MLTGVDKETGEGLSDINIRYQIITFLIAGHETTSGLLSFALYYLLNNPEVLEKAYEEVDRVLGDDLSSPPTNAQVNHLSTSPRYSRSLCVCGQPLPLSTGIPTGRRSWAGSTRSTSRTS